MTATGLTVLVADDQPVILAGLRAMLDAEPDISVTASAADGLEAVALAAAVRPDVVLMDIRMPRLDGIAATRRILEARSATAVVMITTFDDEEYLLDSIRAGACGFLLKDAGADLLAAAVRSAVRGNALIDPGMTRALLERRLERATLDEAAVGAYSATLASLSEREREVLAAISRGLSNAEIAVELFVSEATVKTHIGSVLSKIGVRSRVGAAVFAYESGFIRPGAGPVAP
ncbi:DNA-binding response regulator [Actinomycetota bacterium]|nr:DNA-binding response regulator [Actinomycetota bacterium]